MLYQSARTRAHTHTTPAPSVNVANCLRCYVLCASLLPDFGFVSSSLSFAINVRLLQERVATPNVKCLTECLVLISSSYNNREEWVFWKTVSSLMWIGWSDFFF